MSKKASNLLRVYPTDLIELKRIRELISFEWGRKASLADVVRQLLRRSTQFKDTSSK